MTHRRNASLGRRCAAVAYEGLLLAAIVLLVGFLTAPVVTSAPGTMGTLRVPPMPARVLSAAMVFGAAGLYFAWSWSGGRRTLPMKTWRLALERVDGLPVDGRSAVTRYLATWIGPLAALIAYAAMKPAGLGSYAPWFIAIGYLWAFADSDRQFLHDRIAGTRIVMSPAPLSAARARRPR